MYSASNNLYRPIATWSGRLILPAQAQRRKDGGVFLEVENAPSAHTSLIGKTVGLRWHPNSLHQRWLSRATIDIKFDEITHKSIEKSQAIHPTRLNGWPQVSPLESLAGARPADDIQVELDVLSVDREGNSWVLSIGDEPYQIVGVQKALIRFISPTGDKHYRIRHYNPLTKSFDGLEEIVACPDAGIVYPETEVEHTSVENIERSLLNPGGWYIYGKRHSSGTFLVQALEPADALRLTATAMVIGRGEAQDYFVESKWKPMPVRRAEKVLIDNNGPVVPPAQRTPALRDKRTRELWYPGDIALVVHTFGWRGGPRGSNPPLGIAPGHFSFGFAKVMRDEFTGDLRFDIIYRQVYAHNKEGIVAGAQRWHAYEGSLKRGWLYTLPISDVMVRSPELTVPYKLGDRTFDPLVTIKQELAFMEARYRTGPGNGASLVTPATSCVKDSCQALFSAIKRLDAEVLDDPTLEKWLQKNPQNYDAQRFQKLETLLEDVQARMLVPLGYVPKGWRGDNEYVAAHRRGPTDFAGIIEALKSWKTLLPRRAEMELLQVLSRHGATFWDLKGVMMGGEIPGIVPIPPGVIL